MGYKGAHFKSNNPNFFAYLSLFNKGANNEL